MSEGARERKNEQIHLTMTRLSLLDYGYHTVHTVHLCFKYINANVSHSLSILILGPFRSYVYFGRLWLPLDIKYVISNES